MNFAKKTQYNIKVDIHEVKELSFRESANEREILPNPYIEVTVNNEKRSTSKKNQAANVVYNTSFNFSMNLTDYHFERTSVDICVLHKYTIQSALIGKCTFSLNYVYSKVQHWLYRIWVKLRNPDLPLDDVGYVLLSVGVYGPGDSIPMVNDSIKNNVNEEEICTEKGLDIHITHYNLCVNIYKGQDIQFIGNNTLFSNTLETYVKVYHNGLEECTKIIRNDPNPVWNVSVYIPTCTPCYDKNIIIELINGENNGTIIYSILLDLFDILKRELQPRWFNLYYNPQNRLMVRCNNMYTQNNPTILNTSSNNNNNSVNNTNALGNYIFTSTAEKIFKNATQGITINDILGVTKVQNIFSDDTLKEFYLYGGRLFLSVYATKTYVPGPICIKSAKVESEPPNKEFIFCADIYEILSVHNSKSIHYDNINEKMNFTKNTFNTFGDTIICVCGLGPHKLKTPPLLPNEGGSYVLNENTGRIDEFRIFLPQHCNEQIYDIFLYIYVKSTMAVTDWITNRQNLYNGILNTEYENRDVSNLPKLNKMNSINTTSDTLFNDLDAFSNYKLSSYVRIPFKYLLLNENKPRWLAMKNIETSIHDYNVSFFANLIPYDQYKKRPQRLEYKLSRYFFRALIYEGLHFPAKGCDAFPDPYIKIELAGQVIKTSTILHTLNPNYYEAYEVEVILPTNLDLAPDISIEAFSVNKSFLYNDDILLGSCTFSIMKVPVEWKKSPIWVNLKSSQYKKCKAKLLVAFELVPYKMVKDDIYPFYDDIRPSTLPGHVSLFLVGIRMFKPLKDPSVTVCFGRDVDDTSQFLWHETTNKVTSGKEGNWNFLKYFSLDVALPKRMQHHCFLEVRVEDRVNATGGFTTTTTNTTHSVNATNDDFLIGTAYITLNPLLPWLDRYEQNECRELFKLHLLEEVLIEDAEKARKSYNAALIYKKSSIMSRKLSNGEFDMCDGQDINDAQETRDTRGTRDTHESDEGEMEIVAEKTSELAIELAADVTANLGVDVVASTQKKKKKNQRKGMNNEYVPYNDPDFANVRIEEALEHVCFREEGAQDEQGDYEEGGSQEVKCSGEAHLGGEKNIHGKKKPGRSIEEKMIYGFNEDMLNFRLSLADDDEQEEVQRDEMLYEYEVDMNVEDLPYLRATIFRCTDSGIPEAVGYLKYICNVYDEKTMHLKKEMIKQCDKLVSEYKLTRNLVVRAYIIQARGLNPPSGATDITTYIWIKNSNEVINIPGGLSHNIKDTGHTKKQGFKPEFNRCFQLLCSFPDESIVQVCIMSQGSISDEIIGYTYIDMEDRYFNNKIRQLMIDDLIPIELRSLKLENSTISHGSLRCWFEIFTEEFAQLNPVKILCSNEPDDYQLRLVIWKVTNVAMDDNSTVSLFVRCIYTDEDSEDRRDTDIHYNSKDGKGIFNWRFVYNVKIPTNATTVKVQVHNYALLSTSEPIGEATLDLSAHFYRARKKKGFYHIPRFWMQCRHPAHKNKIRANVELEGSILPKAEAELDPVGNGRDEPNKDPYLPPITENRTYVDWVTINEKFGAATASIMHGLKWTGVWVVVAVVVVGVFFLLFLLK
ncbi:ferlin, putative [Plasmodium ovale]|uniref:Ferlin, putative n=1 Tax=Plasmodium ovale TaxID=36330 RepID=A0A1D3KYT6_PLAOA|nr:ferlin, putative [Plasmodium ovale]